MICRHYFSTYSSTLLIVFNFRFLSSIFILDFFLLFFSICTKCNLCFQQNLNRKQNKTLFFSVLPHPSFFFKNRKLELSFNTKVSLSGTVWKSSGIQTTKIRHKNSALSNYTRLIWKNSYSGERDKQQFQQQQDIFYAKTLSKTLSKNQTKSDKNYKKKTVLQNNTYCVQILYWSSLYFSHFSNQLLKKTIHTYLLYFEIPGYTIFSRMFFVNKTCLWTFFSVFSFSVTFYLLELLSLFLSFCDLYLVFVEMLIYTI